MFDEPRNLSEGPGPLLVACPKKECDWSFESQELRKIAVDHLARHFKKQHAVDYGPRSPVMRVSNA